MSNGGVFCLHSGIKTPSLSIQHSTLNIKLYYCLYTSNALVNSLAPGGRADQRLGLYSIRTEAPLNISFLLSDCTYDSLDPPTTNQ